MTRLLLPVPVTLILFAVLCVCAILVGRSQPAADSFLRLGDLLVRFDAPCSLTLTADAVVVQYPHVLAQIAIPRDIDLMRGTLMSPRLVITHEFTDAIPCEAPLVVPSSRNIYLRWCGFRSLGDYIAQCRLPGLVLLPE
jgi:hypothetical protein